MSTHLRSLDGHADIPLDRDLVVVGRHPRCDARIDSHQVSRHHCCLAREGDEVAVRDLDSTNGIRINGCWSEAGRLRPGDELKIAHLRYRLESGPPFDATLTSDEPASGRPDADLGRHTGSVLHRPGDDRETALADIRPPDMPGRRGRS